jgi:LAO/AO transport system kinase
MPQLSAESHAYIRPAPSAGTLGGVANHTRESMLVCEAAGYDVILIETVGVGQSETMVADMTDCFLALMLPGAGDELQGIKRGLLELVDVIAVNKADGKTKAAAEQAAHQYDIALKSLSSRSSQEWPPEVLTCSALNQTGVQQVWQAIEQRFADLKENGGLKERRGRQNLRWLWSLVEQELKHAIQAHKQVGAIRDGLERDVIAGIVPPKIAAQKIMDAFQRGRTKRDDDLELPKQSKNPLDAGLSNEY